MRNSKGNIRFSAMSISLYKWTQMNWLPAFIILAVLNSCNCVKQKERNDLIKQKSEALSLDRDRLNYYFDEFEIKPWIAVNNTEINQAVVQLSKHKVTWIKTEEATKIKIDNDLFTLKNKVTINIVWNEKNNVDFANDWDEIKLYKFNGRELIGIRMSNHRCSGLGCSVDYFLVYDLKTKVKNFFGTFRTDNKLALYNFNNDGELDYLSKTFNGDAGGSTPMEFIYELYSMKQNGRFILQKNKDGQTYQIKQTTFPNDSTKTETFEQRWLTEIKP